MLISMMESMRNTQLCFDKFSTLENQVHSNRIKGDGVLKATTTKNIHSMNSLLRDLLTFREHKMKSVRNGGQIEHKK